MQGLTGLQYDGAIPGHKFRTPLQAMKDVRICSQWKRHGYRTQLKDFQGPMGTMSVDQ